MWGCGIFTICFNIAFLCRASTLLLAVCLWGCSPCGEVQCWGKGNIKIGFKMGCGNTQAIDIGVFGRLSLSCDLFKCQRQSHMSHPSIFVGHGLKKNVCPKLKTPTMNSFQLHCRMFFLRICDVAMVCSCGIARVT